MKVSKKEVITLSELLNDSNNQLPKMAIPRREG
jgi:hypothetical protein